MTNASYDSCHGGLLTALLVVVGMASENPLTLKETIHVSDLKQCRIILAKRPSLMDGNNG